MNYVIVDIETTGGSPKASKITEIAISKRLDMIFAGHIYVQYVLQDMLSREWNPIVWGNYHAV